MEQNAHSLRVVLVTLTWQYPTQRTFVVLGWLWWAALKELQTVYVEHPYFHCAGTQVVLWADSSVDFKIHQDEWLLLKGGTLPGKGPRDDSQKPPEQWASPPEYHQCLSEHAAAHPRVLEQSGKFLKPPRTRLSAWAASSARTSVCCGPISHCYFCIVEITHPN